jgi:hypothetical protein
MDESPACPLVHLAEAPEFKAPGPSSLDQLKDTAAALRAKAAEKASELRHRAADAVSKAAEIAVDKASDLGHKATDAASGVRKRITDSGPDLIQRAAEKFSVVGYKITNKTLSLIQKASEHSLAPKFKHDEIGGKTGAERREQEATASTVAQGFFEHEQRRS